MNLRHARLPLWFSGFLALTAPANAGGLAVDRVVIDANFPGAYQVEVADVNGDGKPDVIAVGGGTCAWYENPKWTKRVVTGPGQSPGVISSATADLDGDGKAEVAVAYQFSMNEPTRGKLLIARQGKTPDDPWTVEPVGDLPSIHRLRWADLNNDKRPELVVAPIFGPRATPPKFQEEGATLSIFFPKPGLPAKDWPVERPDFTFPVLHAVEATDSDLDGRAEVRVASNLGVSELLRGPTGAWTSRNLTPGAPGEAPKRGSSEVHLGRLKDGRRFLATVDPWHGTDVAVCLSTDSGGFGPRLAIDTTLKEAHALWTADVDGDGDDEIFAGYRGPGTSVVAYDFNGKTWDRTLVDPATAAQDLRGGDLDADGRPDIVAAGGSTHNVVWYRPKR